MAWNMFNSRSRVIASAFIACLAVAMSGGALAKKPDNPGGGKGGGGNGQPDVTPPANIVLTADPTALAITLGWIASGDDGDIGTAAHYEVLYGEVQSDGSCGVQTKAERSDEVVPVEGGLPENFIVRPLTPGTEYCFTVQVFDDADLFSDVAEVTARTEDHPWTLEKAFETPPNEIPQPAGHIRLRFSSIDPIDAIPSIAWIGRHPDGNSPDSDFADTMNFAQRSGPMSDPWAVQRNLAAGEINSRLGVNVKFADDGLARALIQGRLIDPDAKIGRGQLGPGPRLLFAEQQFAEQQTDPIWGPWEEVVQPWEGAETDLALVHGGSGELNPTVGYVSTTETRTTRRDAMTILDRSNGWWRSNEVLVCDNINTRLNQHVAVLGELFMYEHAYGFPAFIGIMAAAPPCPDDNCEIDWILLGEQDANGWDFFQSGPLGPIDNNFRRFALDDMGNLVIAGRVETEGAYDVVSARVTLDWVSEAEACNPPGSSVPAIDYDVAYSSPSSVLVVGLSVSGSDIHIASAHPSAGPPWRYEIRVASQCTGDPNFWNVERVDQTNSAHHSHLGLNPFGNLSLAYPWGYQPFPLDAYSPLPPEVIYLATRSGNPCDPQ